MTNIKDNKQSGVTLLLAILVLSSILAISFSLATILFIEVRTSGDLLRTEAALYGAEAVSEGALFGLQHKVPSSIMDYAYITKTSDGRVSLTSTTSPLSDVQNDIVSKSAIDLEHAKRYGLYDVSAQDPAQVGSGYGKFKVTILNTGNQDRLQVWVCEFTPQLSINIYPDCIDSDGYPHQTLKDTLSTRPAMPSTGSWLLDPNMQQELVLVNAEGEMATGDLYIEIEAFGPETPPGSGTYLSKGLPNFDRTVIDINAVNGGVNRRVRTIVPNSSTISGYTSSANYAAAANGGVASASSEYNSVNYYPAAAAINGDRKGVGWGQPGGNGGWNNADSDPWPNWLQVAFSGPKNISEIDVYTLADVYPLASDPGPADTFTKYGVTDFQVQYDNGSGWQNVPGGAIAGNNLIWRRIAFPTISNVTKIRVLVSQGLAGYSRIVELEAY